MLGRDEIVQKAQMYTPHTCICHTFTKYKSMIHTIFFKNFESK